MKDSIHTYTFFFIAMRMILRGSRTGFLHSSLKAHKS